MKELIEKLEILKDKLISSEDFEFLGQFEIIQEAIQAIQQKEETNAEELKRHAIGFLEYWYEVPIDKNMLNLDYENYLNTLTTKE